MHFDACSLRPEHRYFAVLTTADHSELTELGPFRCVPNHRVAEHTVSTASIDSLEKAECDVIVLMASFLIAADRSKVQRGLA